MQRHATCMPRCVFRQENENEKQKRILSIKMNFILNYPAFITAAYTQTRSLHLLVIQSLAVCSPLYNDYIFLFFFLFFCLFLSLSLSVSLCLSLEKHTNTISLWCTRAPSTWNSHHFSLNLWFERRSVVSWPACMPFLFLIISERFVLRLLYRIFDKSEL